VILAPPTQCSVEASSNSEYNVHYHFETNFAKEKGLTKDTNSDTGFLEIDYDGGRWEGSVLDSISTSASHDGVQAQYRFHIVMTGFIQW
jgi:hypothetical protein